MPTAYHAKLFANERDRFRNTTAVRPWRREPFFATKWPVVPAETPPAKR
jgi:hypothetical protein